MNFKKIYVPSDEDVIRRREKYGCDGHCEQCIGIDDCDETRIGEFYGTLFAIIILGIGFLGTIAIGVGMIYHGFKFVAVIFR